MSGTRGTSQQFGIRLSIDGTDAVESGLRRVQGAAATAAAAIEQTGQTTGRALAVIERGTQAASQGLTKMGGDFAALAPIVDNAGGAVGRLVTALGSGAGLLGVLGAVGGVVGAAVAVYQNWDAVTRAVAGSMDVLTGRVRAVRAELQSTYDLLNQLNGIAPQGASNAARAAIGQIDAQADPIRARIAENERRLAAAQAGGGAAATIRRGSASGLQPTDDFARDLDRQLIERQQRAQATRAAEIERELRADRAALADLDAARRREQGRIAAAEENVGSVTRPPAEEPRDRPARTGGGGGGARPARDDLTPLLRERDAFTARNDPFERYRQTLESIVSLNDRLVAAGQNPLPDEVVIRATDQAMQDYQRAVQAAGDSTRNLADGTKELERAGGAAAKALAGAFEDLVFEGQSFDDVLKNLERSLLRIGNQFFLQPLFQQGLGLLFGSGGDSKGGGGIGGLIGQGISALGSLFSAPVAHDGALVGAAGGVSRMVPAAVFAHAPRFHGGGIIGPDERPIIAQVGERVLSRAETAAYNRGGVTVNISTPDAGSFRNSQGQIMSRMAASLARAGRNR
jgi:hypothetical protein